MIPYKQLSLADIFSNCQEKFEEDKYSFLSLLEQHINLDELIPISFRNHFYAYTGRRRNRRLPIYGTRCHRACTARFFQNLFPRFYFHQGQEPC